MAPDPVAQRARRHAADYTGLPGWYVLQLVESRLAQLGRESGQTGRRRQLIVAGGTVLAARLGISRTYMHDLTNHRIGICGLQMSERILAACGINVGTVRADMFIPFPGFRNAIKMASDELYALRIPLTEPALLDRAQHLADRRDLLLSLRPSQ
jgi:hypothetical protein